MFTNLINKSRKNAKIGKHQMSKKNAKHVKNLSYGEKKHIEYLKDKNIRFNPES